ncbi:hypothetical protein HanRHA438_Chr00c22g0853051 [Helianthus annuus]|nr:hypothetical protein HanRHA438_Chr00c22g0853051 [Helianthus annuus]
MNNHLLPLFIITLLVALASASSSNSRTSDIEELQSFNHSSMAARIKEIEMRNEKAVQDPEEVVAMVEMYKFTPLSSTYLHTLIRVAFNCHIK